MAHRLFVRLALAGFALLFVNSLFAADVTLVRFGPMGEEKPGLVDGDGRLRDLSSVIDDITPETLSDAGMAQLGELDADELPLGSGNPR